MIPVNQPLLDGNEKKYLIECIDTGWISSEGPFVEKFEKQFAATVGRRHAIAVANGSLALDAAMAALDLSAGDEVLMPSFTIISCASAILRAGAVPVVVDADSITWNMDVTKIESQITHRTKAIMVVHIYGLPCDMDPILALSRKYNLFVIEDSAEMLGQTYRNNPCGSFGDISIFSFYPNKLVTTGEGGMIVTDSDILANKFRSLRNLYFTTEHRFVHEQIGWNMRMTNLQAALGVAQLERLSSFVERKRAIGKLYTKLLNNIPGLILPIESTQYARNIYWIYGIVLDERMGFDAKEAMRRLRVAGVDTRPFFWPMHKQPVFNRIGLFSDVECPVAENIARRGFYIPSGLALTDEQIMKVSDTVAEVLK